MDIRIEPWTEADLELERRINVPEMKQHLGGPEPDEAIVARHRRYLELEKNGKGQMFRILLAGEEAPVGAVGFWEKEWEGSTVYEMGWSVLPGHQGRGVAVNATAAAVAAARAAGKHRYAYAYPSVDNAASNAVCRKVGFEFAAETDFEFPKGNPLRCNIWRIDLAA